jgi:phage shock protein PspC (stress-responsive transcriptional regulator)
MTIPTAPPPAADATDSAAGTRSPHATSPSAERFFLWFAGLGIARSDGWLGGIAAGIAARLRIDPLIVRGVLVIAALFGLPVIFLYALAWALLPDADGRIHARDLLNRDFQPVQLGILGMAVVGLIPTAPLSGRLFGLGYDSWSALAIFSWIAGLAVVGGLLFLIVRAASRTPDVPASSGQASPDSAAPGASATLGDSGTAEGAGATPRRSPSPWLPRPTPPEDTRSPPASVRSPRRRSPRAARTPKSSPPGACSMRPGASRIRPGADSSRMPNVPPATRCAGSARLPPRPSRPKRLSDAASVAPRTPARASRSSPRRWGWHWRSARPWVSPAGPPPARWDFSAPRSCSQWE